ncbi:MAG: AsmA family protein, partial [Burkholderiales bacterium]
MNARKPLWIVLAIVAGLFLLVVGAIAWVESEAGQRWIEAKVSEASGREVSIGDIDIKMGLSPGVRVSGLRITNPEWAKSSHLVDTEYIDARFRLLPLVYGRMVVEDLTLVQARIGAEREANRNTWTFRKKDEEQDKPFPAIVRRINIDRGYVYYRDAPLKTTLEIDVAGDVGGGGAIDVTAKGTYRGQNTRAVARLPGLLPTPD